MAARIRVVGIVQGVGFRPHVYRLAKSLGLKGYVKNLGGAEVEVWIEGNGAAIEEFVVILREKTPEAAEIEEIEVFPERPRGYSDFTIEKSGEEKAKISMIPPDFGVCGECLREILDPASRWYRYPFHSCAWCGPRFSVIHKPPYDRGNTSWKSFPLCSECLKEYADPGNLRRFHIQGISCPHCGPKLRLVDSKGEEVGGDPLATAAKLIDEGYIVAVKGIGGFHLAALATDDDVVAKLRSRKRRKRKPLAIMVLDLKVANSIVEVSKEAGKVLESPARPIVILPRKENSRVSKLVAPKLRTLGVMLAYTPLHYLLLLETRDKFLVMTSGNESGEPIIRDDHEALYKLSHVADFFLLHNRKIVNRVDDSVVRFTDGTLTLIRRARGYAPRWLELPREARRTGVATGAMLMNTAAVATDKYIIPTQHIGDVENLETLEFMSEALEFLVNAYDIKLEEAVVISDKHPSYPTRSFALEIAEKWHAERFEVQHHAAHVAAGMLEYKLEESTGIAIDGVGYGDDGSIWGGEVIHISSGNGYSRAGHLEYFPLPGGDRAAEYPARIILGVLVDVLGPEEGLKHFIARGYHNILPGGFSETLAALTQIKKAPLASSTGRFLDAVAAALWVAHERSYEGEPAITLEEFSWGGELVPLPIEVEDGVILVKEFLAELASGSYSSLPARDIARSAQQLLGRAFGTIAREERAKRVIVSGGAAVNEYIIKGIREVIGKDSVLLMRKLPPGDGSISAGQLYYAFLEELL